MFWELHRNIREADMRELSQTLTDFLFYAAGQGGTSLDEAALRRALPQSCDWLLEQFHGEEKNRKKLQQAIDGLFLLPPDRRREIAYAAAHDMDFDRTADPSRFHFAVPALPKQEQQILKNFFSYFYDPAFHRQVGPSLNGRTSRAVRCEFSDAYYRANTALHSVCPVCLKQESFADKENELEHYFPKETYSPLILHPSNLFFICKECNKTYKGTRDALRKGKKPLSKVFLPYQDTVKDHTKVTFQRRANTDQVKLMSVSGLPDEQERVKNFNYLYQLEARWSADIERIFEQLRKYCSVRQYTRGEVRQKLLDKCEELQALSDFPDKYLESAYLHWLCDTMFDVFYDSL